MKNMEKVKTDVFDLEDAQCYICNYHAEEGMLAYLTLERVARALVKFGWLPLAP